jgi:hypothetical protein
MSGDSQPVEPYAYPESPHQRRHRPAGYASYDEYLPWVQDEFAFRCVYCLKRMVWAPTDVWTIDHVVPKQEAPELVCDYENLVFACQCCNRQKSSHRVTDPCQVAYGSCLQVKANGEVTWLNTRGKRLVQTIRLNHPRYVQERLKILRFVQLAAGCDPALLEWLMSYPSVLPDLSRLKPPGGNRRPEGLRQSFHARRRRGDLAKTY